MHSFWVPQLAGKTDLLPNRVNEMWIDPHETGLFVGQCAQFCGPEHAKMLLRVYVDSPEQFKQWIAHQQQMQPELKGPESAEQSSPNAGNPDVVHASGKTAPANSPLTRGNVALNSATVPQNTRATGNTKIQADGGNPGFNITLPAGTSKVVDPFLPQPIPVMINCDIHPWMKAWAGVYEHPYVTLTKEDGTFTIPRVPAGATVIVQGYHGGVGFVPGPKGEEIELKAKENTIEFKIKARQP